MTAFDVLEEVRRRPFEPFRMYVTDGSVYDIRHPDQCLVLVTAVIVGVATDPNAYGYERSVKLSCDHIVKLEPIRAIPAAG